MIYAPLSTLQVINSDFERNTLSRKMAKMKSIIEKIDNARPAMSIEGVIGLNKGDKAMLYKIH
jgi:hypothetical protein